MRTAHSEIRPTNIVKSYYAFMLDFLILFILIVYVLFIYHFMIFYGRLNKENCEININK